ncbi:MAG: GH32 C-terminal domain-containing protein, partial [Clostridium sp.]|nr:GH32 C-terminal domain-containing protein [Clostridium sp.]
PEALMGESRKQEPEAGRDRAGEFDAEAHLKGDWENEPGKGLSYECIMSFDSCRSMTLTLRNGAFLTYNEGLLTLDIEALGSGRTRRSVALPSLEQLRIFSDVSSLEIFVNHGREVFTTRVYGGESTFLLDGDCSGRGVIYRLNSFTYGKL